MKNLNLTPHYQGIKDWKEAIYGLLIQKEAIKASHYRIFRKLKIVRWH